jgi:hypothetical protein
VRFYAALTDHDFEMLVADLLGAEEGVQYEVFAHVSRILVLAESAPAAGRALSQIHGLNPDHRNGDLCAGGVGP